MVAQGNCWGVWCIRSASSMFGAAQAWAKDADGRPERFASEDAANARAAEIFGRLSMSAMTCLSYSAKLLR